MLVGHSRRRPGRPRPGRSRHGQRRPTTIGQIPAPRHARSRRPWPARSRRPARPDRLASFPEPASSGLEPWRPAPTLPIRPPSAGRRLAPLPSVWIWPQIFCNSCFDLDSNFHISLYMNIWFLFNSCLVGICSQIFVYECMLFVKWHEEPFESRSMKFAWTLWFHRWIHVNIR
jgi:hypothetical protein